MFFYTLFKEINNQVFKDACKTIEHRYPDAEKYELLIDVDGSLYQDYCVCGKKIKVNNDCEVDAVYIDSEINLDDIFMSLV